MDQVIVTASSSNLDQAIADMIIIREEVFVSVSCNVFMERFYYFFCPINLSMKLTFYGV